MFFRRYIVGIVPLLVWAEDEEAADVTALIHASLMLPGKLETPSWLPFGSGVDPE